MLPLSKEELPKLTDEEDSPLEQLQSRALITEPNAKLLDQVLRSLTSFGFTKFL